MKLNVKTKFLGRNCIFYNLIDSTQKEIWRLIEKDVPTGTIVIANLQTEAYGTQGRKWYTDENNIAFSLYIKLNHNIKRMDGVTVEIAETIIDVFFKLYNISLNIKSPNDIVFNSKKIGGILTESRIQKEKITDLVIGIGINTSQIVFYKELEGIATSIKKEFNIDVDVLKFIEEFCNQFERRILNRLGEV